MYMENSISTRVIIKVCVTDIPGKPLRRHTTLGEIFCREMLDRDFNPQPNQSGYDGVTIPNGFDSDQPVKRWFIYDFNVQTTLNREEVIKLPHRVFFAERRDTKW